MVHAVVLLTVKRDQINAVAAALQRIPGITEVYTVAGRYDLVAMIRASTDDAFAEIVTEGMLHVDGIKASETLIAFKVFSDYDLESVFS